MLKIHKHTRNFAIGCIVIILATAVGLTIANSRALEAATNPTPTPRVPCPAQLTGTAVALIPRISSVKIFDPTVQAYVPAATWFAKASGTTPSTPAPTETINPTAMPTPPAWPTPDLSYPWSLFHPAWLFGGAKYCRAPRDQTFWEAQAFHVDCPFNNGQHTVFVKVTSDYDQPTKNYKVCFTWEGNVNPPICQYPDKDEWVGLDFPMYGASYEVWVYDFPYTSDRVSGLTSCPEFPDPSVYPVYNPVTGWGYPGCTCRHNSWAIWFWLRRVGFPTSTPTATTSPEPTATGTATSTAMATETLTATPILIPTPTPTASPEATVTETPVISPTPTSCPTLSPEQMDEMTEKIYEVWLAAHDHPEDYGILMRWLNMWLRWWEGK